MRLTEHQNRIKDLLKDTITLLCKNGLQYKARFSVEALIGITLDDEEIFLVNIKESIGNEENKGIDVTIEKQNNESKLKPENEQHVSLNKSQNLKYSTHKRSLDKSSLLEEHLLSKKLRLENADSSNVSVNFPFDEPKNFSLPIKEEPGCRDDELVFIKQEAGIKHDSCSQSSSHIVPGGFQYSSEQFSRSTANANLSLDSLNQTGVSSRNMLPSMPWNFGENSHGKQSERGVWSFPCSLCDKVYKTKQNRDAHMRSRHKAGEELRCSCGLTFRWPSTLSKHRKKCPTEAKEMLDMSVVSGTLNGSLPNHTNPDACSKPPPVEKIEESVTKDTVNNSQQLGIGSMAEAMVQRYLGLQANLNVAVENVNNVTENGGFGPIAPVVREKEHILNSPELSSMEAERRESDSGGPSIPVTEAEDHSSCGS